MRFAELLDRAVLLSSSIDSSRWISYKGLKALLPAEAPGGSQPLPPAASPAAALAASPLEVAFFAQLTLEVRRVASHYSSAEAALAARFDALLSALTGFLVAHPPGTPHGTSAGEELLREIVALTSALVQLENYAVLNYAGVGKILKKHDKQQGVATRAAFMQAFVNGQAFASCPELRRMLSGTERAFSLLSACSAADGRAPAERSIKPQCEQTAAAKAQLAELLHVRVGAALTDGEDREDGGAGGGVPALEAMIEGGGGVPPAGRAPKRALAEISREEG